MSGYAVGGQCVRDVAPAVASACAGVSGVTSGGVVSCTAPSLSGSVMSYTLVTESGSGRIERSASMTLQDCTPADLTEYGPAISAWFLALLSLYLVRSLLTGIFNRGLPS